MIKKTQVESWTEQEEKGRKGGRRPARLPAVLVGAAKLKVEPGTAAEVVLVPKPPKAPDQRRPQHETQTNTHTLASILA